MGPEVWTDFSRNLANLIAPQVGAAGMQLWTGLSLIVVVWTGTQMALAGGGVNMASIVRMIITLAIPLGMLRFYFIQVPGIGMNVPDVITGMGSWLSNVIIADAGENFRGQLGVMLRQAWANVGLTADQETGWFNQLAGWIGGFIGMINTLVVGLLMSLVMLVVLIVVYAVGQAQVIWAQLAITLAILLGPIFIPFLVLPPLSFLFWGWFRTLLTYSLYAAIAAAVFRITTQVGMQMLTTLTEPGPYGTPEGNQIVMANLSLVLLYGVAALLASLKVGEFATMLLAGGGSASSSAGSRVIQVARIAATKGMT